MCHGPMVNCAHSILSPLFWAIDQPGIFLSALTPNPPSCSTPPYSARRHERVLPGTLHRGVALDEDSHAAGPCSFDPRATLLWRFEMERGYPMPSPEASLALTPFFFSTCKAIITGSSKYGLSSCMPWRRCPACWHTPRSTPPHEPLDEQELDLLLRRRRP